MPELPNAPPAVVADAAAPVRIDLLARATSCRTAVADEIVVCAAEESPYRLRPLDARFERGPVRAEASLGPGVRGAIVGETATLPGGNMSQRVMVTIGTKF